MNDKITKTCHFLSFFKK